ncbi:MAG: SgcJ/EcaC family oxidoreductase [Gemmatimonadaceae bacterium]
MSPDLVPIDRAALAEVVRRLEAAWNAMDGAAFAADFADDADFVNIRGEHFRGRPAIAAGHAAILGTIYAGSTNRYTVEAARLLRPEVALVHVHSRLDAPHGPLAGRHTARFSLVLTREPSGWQIVAFHNTLEPTPGPPPR